MLKLIRHFAYYILCGIVLLYLSDIDLAEAADGFTLKKTLCSEGYFIASCSNDKLLYSSSTNEVNTSKDYAQYQCNTVYTCKKCPAGMTTPSSTIEYHYETNDNEITKCGADAIASSQDNMYDSGCVSAWNLHKLNDCFISTAKHSDETGDWQFDFSNSNSVDTRLNAVKEKYKDDCMYNSTYSDYLNKYYTE